MSQGDPCPVCHTPRDASCYGGLCPVCLVNGVSIFGFGDAEGAPASPSELNEALPEFDVHDIIGKGGMGTVYRARQRQLDREVAIKLLGSGETRSTASFAERFVREAQVTARLDHPSVVPVYDTGYDARGRCYYTMRLVEGRDLGRIISLARKEQDGWNLNRAVGVLVKVCQALAYAHGKDIIHRDLKPANIMVGQLGEVYVMDWGLARMSGRDDAREGSVVGTPAYMAPEQAHGKSAEMDQLSDIYSLGAILYHLITGHPPHMAAGSSSTPDQVLSAVRETPVEFREAILQGVSAELVAIASKAMARERGNRYPSAHDLAEDLQAYLDGRVVKAYESGAFATTRKWIRRNRFLAIAGAATVTVAVIGLAAVAIIQTRSKHAISGALQRETAARESAVRTLADSFLNSGVHVGDEGGFATAALWFTKASMTNPPDSDLARLNRMRAIEYTRAAVVPVRIFQGSHARTGIFQFSGENRYLLRATIQGFELYDLENERALPLDGITAAAFIPATLQLAVSPGPDEVRIRDLSGKTPEKTLLWAGELGIIHGMGFSADGNRLFLGCDPPRIWNSASQSFEPGAIPTSPGRKPCFAVFGSTPNELGVFQWDSIDKTLVYRREAIGSSWSLLPASKGSPLEKANPSRNLVAFPDGVTRIDALRQVLMEPGLPDRRLAENSIAFNGVAVSPDGTLIASASFTGLVTVSRVAAPPRHRLIPRQGGAPIRPVLSPRGGHLVPVGRRCADSLGDSGNWEVRSTRVHQLPDGEPAGPPLDPGAPILDAAFAPAGDTLVLACSAPGRSRESMARTDGTAGFLQFWNWQSGAAVGQRIPMPSEPRSVLFHPDGSWVAAVCAAGQVLRVDPRTGAATLLFRGQQTKINDGGNYHVAFGGPGRLRFAENGRYLLAWEIGSHVHVWDVAENRHQLPPIPLDHSPNDMDLRGTTLMTTGLFKNDEHPWFRDVRTGEGLPASASKLIDIHAGRLNRAGDRLLVSGLGSSIVLLDWNPGGGGVCAEFKLGVRCWTYAGFLDPEPLVFALVNPEAESPYARIWDHLTGRPLTPPFLLPACDRINSLEITADATLAAAACPPCGIVVWDLRRLGMDEVTLTPEDRRLLAQINARAEIRGGTLFRLSEMEWFARWQEFRRRHPSYHNLTWSDEERRSYHVFHMHARAAQGHSATAAWHRQQLDSPPH